MTKRLNLSDVFDAIAVKELVQVDLPSGSHQHEFNGVSSLRELFGNTKTSGIIQWYFFRDNEELLQEQNEFKFYDAREKSAAQTGRIEWRLYYRGEFPANASIGDVLVLTRSRQRYYGFIFQKSSAWLRIAQELFQFEKPSPQFGLIRKDVLSTSEIEFARRQILETIGIEPPVLSDPGDEELVVEKFGFVFPTTREMGNFARSNIKQRSTNPDELLMQWIEREYELFLALERLVLQEPLKKGFSDVDTFLQYSLTVQNRRKSRMGHSLQNHLAALFDEHKLTYEMNALTEEKNRPDFLFPGSHQYHDIHFRIDLLTMLGAKSTCKDRWRQILTEADKIRRKHLCTLEQAISTTQTDEMERQNVQLVIPKKLHSGYTKDQIENIWTVSSFIESVKDNERLGKN